MKNEPVEIEDVYCDYETAAAIHILYGKGEDKWIPKSLIDDDSEVYKKGDEGTLILPEWFAIKEGLVLNV